MEVEEIKKKVKSIVNNKLLNDLESTQFKELAKKLEDMEIDIEFKIQGVEFAILPMEMMDRNTEIVNLVRDLAVEETVKLLKNQGE